MPIYRKAKERELKLYRSMLRDYRNYHKKYGRGTDNLKFGFYYYLFFQHGINVCEDDFQRMKHIPVLLALRPPNIETDHWFTPADLKPRIGILRMAIKILERRLE